MSALVRLLVLLVASPLLVFVLHAVFHRVLDRPGRRVSAHSSAFVAIIAGFVVLLAAAWWLDLLQRDTPLDVIGSLGYIGAVYGTLAILYIDVVNVAETSLHMHLLLELAWGGSLDVERVREQYSEARMIQARLHRLASMGQLRIEGDHCLITNRSTLRFAALIDVWRRILGLPTEPITAVPQEAGSQDPVPRMARPHK
jgi:hypothetical protein